MIEITREIEGAADFELGVPRATPLQYDITWPEAGRAPGVVLVIPGFGQDTDAGYSQALRRHVVETTGMGAVSVRYHAFHARPTNGAGLTLEDREFACLLGQAILSEAPVTDYTDVAAIAAALAQVRPDISPRIVIEPKGGERQNFGVLQALDHLRVVGDLLENAPPFDTRRIVALGSSHGGYIAHLIAKFAPNTLAAIIDNSSYAQPPMSFLQIGDKPELFLTSDHVRFAAQVRSAWSVSDREAANFYSRDRDLIRDLRYLPHAQAMRAAAADGGTQYFMVNACDDEISPAAVKARQQAVLARAGFEAELELVGPGDVDGRLYRTYGHGLGCSLTRLFDRCIGRVRPRRVEPDAILGGGVAYDGVDSGYRFAHGPQAPYVRADVYDLFADHAGEGAIAA